jgi:uncharacterized DUF497 family protein
MSVVAAGFDWDDGNREKCRKHGMTLAEIEHVLVHGETLIVPTPKKAIVEPRFVAIGRTSTGRYAFVVFTPRKTNGETRLRPLSARFMHQKEIDKYEEEISRAQKRQGS